MTFCGRLTLVSGKPIMDADITASTLYYTQHCGDKVSVGGSDISFSEPSISLASLAANAIHDVFIDASGGLFLSAAWTPATGEAYATPVSTITEGSTPIGWSRASAAFDGNAIQSYSVGARTNLVANNGMANFLGQDWGAPKTITKVVIYAPNDDYFRGDATASLPVAVDGWNNSTEGWVRLYTGTLNASLAPPAAPYTITGLPSVSYLKHRVGFSGNGSNAINCAEIKFYECIVGGRSEALARNNGIMTNGANTGTWLGTTQIDPAGGTCSAHISQGGSRRFGVWNRYNQTLLFLKAGVSPGNGNYEPVATIPYWAPLNNDPANCLTVVTGEPTQIEMAFHMTRAVLAGGDHWYDASGNLLFAPGPGLSLATSGQHQCGIGLNRTDLPTGQWAGWSVEVGALPTSILIGTCANAPFVTDPLIGSNTAYALENHRFHGVHITSRPVETMLWAKWLG